MDERFKSGKTIDVNPGELIGLGLVASYYNYYGERLDNTYQVMVGIEDSVKAQVENVLSDGAIWHNQTKNKMLYQTVMFQGYHPEKSVATENIIQKKPQNGEYSQPIPRKLRSNREHVRRIG